MTELTIRRPDNFHVHLRRGRMLRAVLPHTAAVYGRAMVMPNTEEPILDAADAEQYRHEIVRIGWDADDRIVCGKMEPLMTIKLTPETTPATIEAAKAVGVVAAKLYPAGTTTNSHGGVSDFTAPGLIAALAAMRDCGMVLSVHAEMPGAPVLEAETEFLGVIADYLTLVPGLKIVVEHVSTVRMARLVAGGPVNLAATVTPQHLWLTIDDILAGPGPDGRRGLCPHNFCYPVPKAVQDRSVLIDLATSGNPKFFAGDDSAPHRRYHKEAACGCAGVFCAPASLPTYAEVFEATGAIDRLEDFTSRFGAEFYGLPLNEGTVTLERRDPADAGPLVDRIPIAGSVHVRVWRGGERLPWAVREDGGP